MSSLLDIRGLSVGYRGQPVARNVSLAVDAGEIVTVLGPNGAGKTTLLLTLAGILPQIEGDIRLDGEPVHKTSATTRARKGLVLVPDDRALFTTLTTLENLAVRSPRSGMTQEQVLDYFPALRARARVKAAMLSGGEQQMLAVARALVLAPRVLMIDEMSMGLAPTIVADLLPLMRRVAEDAGVGIILVEQHVELALKVSDRALLLVHGSAVYDGRSEDLARNRDLLRDAYLGGSSDAA